MQPIQFSSEINNLSVSFCQVMNIKDKWRFLLSGFTRCRVLSFADDSPGQFRLTYFEKAERDNVYGVAGRIGCLFRTRMWNVLRNGCAMLPAGRDFERSFRWKYCGR
ncbi:hypothetical protein GWI33_007968 [Rhynchophorus ferrugineus]|uniref:Uncharacterized protein n=1 Tax=Rhynchophorus ferrugineus TaxID=354439 RepID=A0A834MCK0_RHYFE|nr:hypothetical protein GWI33_007968 [Rhynchophorus ferrugineus]